MMDYINITPLVDPIINWTNVAPFEPKRPIREPLITQTGLAQSKPFDLFATGTGARTPTAVPDVRTVSDLLERGKEIKFEGANTKIAEISVPFLDELAAALVKEPGVRLEIVSHTADSGDAKKDLALSKRRAEAVKYVLVGKGVGVEQLVATGRGSEDPIAPNITRSGRMRNERMELHRAEGR